MFADAASFEAAVTALTDLAEAPGEHALASRILRRPNVGPPLVAELVVFEPGQVWQHGAFLEPVDHRPGTTTRPIFPYTLRWPVADLEVVEQLCRNAS